MRDVVNNNQDFRKTTYKKWSGCRNAPQSRATGASSGGSTPWTTTLGKLVKAAEPPPSTCVTPPPTMPDAKPDPVLCLLPSTITTGGALLPRDSSFSPLSPATSFSPTTPMLSFSLVPRNSARPSVALLGDGGGGGNGNVDR